MFSMFFVYLITWRPPPDDSSHKRRPQQGPRQVFFLFFGTTNVYLQLRVIWMGMTRIMTMQLPPPLPTPGIALGGSRVETQLRPENPCTLNNFRKVTLSLSCLILSFNMSKIVYAGTTLTKNSIIFFKAHVGVSFEYLSKSHDFKFADRVRNCILGICLAMNSQWWLLDHCVRVLVILNYIAL